VGAPCPRGDRETFDAPSAEAPRQGGQAGEASN
jgi:hypothetical protein